LLESLDFSTVRFAEGDYLRLLVIPLLLTPLWAWQLWRRRRDVLRMRRQRDLPVRERLSIFGDLGYWLSLVFALSFTIVALARPIAVVSLVETAGIDLVILQDGSASMRVKDVQGDRWKRAMVFLRTLGESLRWEDDRVALALFATIATPQVRLTRDPNTYFFFLDHLYDESPFRMQDDTTWDTNIERGIYWGLRLIDKDEEISKAARGAGSSSGGTSVPPNSSSGGAAAPPSNAKAFVLVSDGQAWSGEVATSIALAQKRAIPIFVVGVGTIAGGIIPDPTADATRAVLTSALDRASLATIANAGGGRYFELDREDDRDIANAIIDSTRRRSNSGGVTESTRELYWFALAAAAVFLGAGAIFLRDRTALFLQLTAAAGVLMLMSSIA
jgi:hypothetical protein